MKVTYITSFLLFFQILVSAQEPVDYLKNLSEKSTETKLENVGNVFSDNTTGSFTSY